MVVLGCLTLVHISDSTEYLVSTMTNIQKRQKAALFSVFAFYINFLIKNFYIHIENVVRLKQLFGGNFDKKKCLTILFDQKAILHFMS